MNQSQIESWLRVSLSASGPLAVLFMAKTGMSEGDYQLYLNLVLALAPGLIAAIWGMYRNRESSLIKTVQDMPNVSKVVVLDSANGKTGDMARNENLPKVITDSQNVSDIKGDKS